ncbi:MAG: RDD family protein [Geminocystis sp.]|nr:RDD family protein [Geminocystis sp.]HIK38760.1 RDD family protein [Geminocystis sp. M7585_C2015_104]MCS7148562.1 RDD family protein [Geminocystis sp.]MCX8078175.1 RDD family protein [Geminocystis sp.]MDW8115046.1 RDD family protein [Geminocystis sp.]
MYPQEVKYRRAPNLERRFYAFLIDYITVWLFSSLVRNIFLEFIVFVFLWFILRVIVVSVNKGQSLGRWAMDLKIMDARFQRIPPAHILAKREAIIAFISFLAMVGLKINFHDFLLMLLLLVPVILDGIGVLIDEEGKRAFHDRFCDTIVVPTQRGISLDLKIKKLWRQAKQNWLSRETNRR